MSGGALLICPHAGCTLFGLSLLPCVFVDSGLLVICDCHLQQLWRYNTHAVEMRIQYLNSTTGAGTESQTIMVNDIPEVNKVRSYASMPCGVVFIGQAYMACLSRVAEWFEQHTWSEQHTSAKQAADTVMESVAVIGYCAAGRYTIMLARGTCLVLSYLATLHHAADFWMLAVVPMCTVNPLGAVPIRCAVWHVTGHRHKAGSDGQWQD